MGDPVVTIELNPRERRLYDRLRARIATPLPNARSGLIDLLLLLPDLTILLLRLLRDRRVPILHKGIALAGVAYVISAHRHGVPTATQWVTKLRRTAT